MTPSITNLSFLSYNCLGPPWIPTIEMRRILETLKKLRKSGAGKFLNEINITHFPSGKHANAENLGVKYDITRAFQVGPKDSLGIPMYS